MRYPTYFHSILLLLGILFMNLLAMLALMGLGDLENLALNLSVGLVPQVIVIVIALALRGDWRLPTRGASPGHVVLSVLLILSLQFALNPLFSQLPSSESLARMMDAVRSEPLPLFLWVVVAGPVLEEILFRGIILHGFLANYGARPAIFASALLFALLHLNLEQAPPALVIGLVLGWLYWRTGSLLLCVLVHMLNNGLAFTATVLAPVEETTSTLREEVGSDLLYLLLCAAALLVAVTIFQVLRRRLPDAGPPSPSARRREVEHTEPL